MLFELYWVIDKGIIEMHFYNKPCHPCLVLLIMSPNFLRLKCQLNVRDILFTLEFDINELICQFAYEASHPFNVLSQNIFSRKSISINRILMKSKIDWKSIQNWLKTQCLLEYSYGHHTCPRVKLKGGWIFKIAGGPLNFEFYCIFMLQFQKFSQFWPPSGGVEGGDYEG